jgi:hypothetical protein
MNILASTEWTEQIPADEDTRFRGYAEEMREIVRERATKTGRLGRAVHFKQHAGLLAKLIVGQLPDELRVGPFAEPTTWPVYVRFSNSSNLSLNDLLPDVRGLALKLVGVPGSKLLPGLEQALTQDFVFAHLPAIPFATPDELMMLVRAAKDGPFLLLPRALGSLGPRKLLRFVRVMARAPFVFSLATTRFYTGAPLRFGDRAVRLDLVPESGAAGCFGGGRDALREDLVARLDTQPLQYTLRAQFYVDEATTPIEDASVNWETPYHELAQLVIPPQDLGSPRGRALDEYVEQLSFSPWHTLPELRPLGAMMRARLLAYHESGLERAVLPEPDGSEVF